MLFTGGEFVIVDFEGEPLRPLPERRLKLWASKDVAGMLRSFTYAAEAAKVEFGEDWAERASTAFLRAYWEAAGSGPFASPKAEERKLLLDTMLIEKEAGCPSDPGRDAFRRLGAQCRITLGDW